MKTPTHQKISDIIPEIVEKFGRCRFDEDYPHISTKLCLFWGTEFFMDYVEQLIMVVPTPNRKARQGFPFEAIKELRFIVDSHNEQFPQYVRILNLWTL